jgi:hypothetical protein
MRKTVRLGALLALALLADGVRAAEETPHWSLRGLFVDSCTCGVPCGCVMQGQAAHGCQGINLIRVDSGRYGSTDLAGVRVAVPHQPGDWAIVYFDPSVSEAQREAMLKILEPRARAFGLKVEAVKSAPIQIAGTDGAFKVTVGDVLTLQTEPLMGLDKRQPILHRNMPDPMMPECYQGRATSGSFKDAGHAFELSGTNTFWANLRAKG